MLDVDRVFERLSARARAAVHWTKAPIMAALARLCDEPLTDALINEAVDAVEEPCMVITDAMMRLSDGDYDSLRLAAREDMKRDRARLAAAIADEDSQDTLGWVFCFLGSFYEIALAAFTPSSHVELDVEAVREGMKIPGFRSLMRGLVALMAAMEFVKRDEAASDGLGRIEDLLDASFLHLMKFQRKFGDALDLPTPVPGDHAGHAVHYAERIRALLTKQDWEVLQSARMDDLR